MASKTVKYAKGLLTAGLLVGTLVTTPALAGWGGPAIKTAATGAGSTAVTQAGPDSSERGNAYGRRGGMWAGCQGGPMGGMRGGMWGGRRGPGLGIDRLDAEMLQERLQFVEQRLAVWQDPQTAAALKQLHPDLSDDEIKEWMTNMAERLQEQKKLLEEELEERSAEDAQATAAGVTESK